MRARSWIALVALLAGCGGIAERRDESLSSSNEPQGPIAASPTSGGADESSASTRPASFSSDAATATPAAPLYGPGSLERFAWLEGRWRGRANDVDIEEYWTAPSSNLMVGVHREVGPDNTPFFEYLRITKTKDGVIYWASPRGGAATPFQLSELEPGRAVIANPDHDFPQRIEYRLDDDGLLHAKISGERGGEPASHEWRGWTRTTAPIVPASPTAP